MAGLADHYRVSSVTLTHSQWMFLFHESVSNGVVINTDSLYCVKMSKVSDGVAYLTNIETAKVLCQQSVKVCQQQSVMVLCWQYPLLAPVV